MNRIEKLAEKITGKHVLILLAVQFVVQGAILFGTYPLIQQGGGAPLDLQMFYEPSMVGFYLASIGEAGRSWYLINQCTLDILFPMTYGPAYMALFLWLIKKASMNKVFYRLVAIPMAIVAFDLAENVLIVVSLMKFPNVPAVIESSASIASAAKQSAIMATMAAALLLIALVMGKYLKERKDGA